MYERIRRHGCLLHSGSRCSISPVGEAHQSWMDIERLSPQRGTRTVTRLEELVWTLTLRAHRAAGRMHPAEDDSGWAAAFLA